MEGGVREGEEGNVRRTKGGVRRGVGGRGGSVNMQTRLVQAREPHFRQSDEAKRRRRRRERGVGEKRRRA